METWRWRDGRERGRVWDDRGPSYCIIPQVLSSNSIVIISVKKSGPQIMAKNIGPIVAQSSPDSPGGLGYLSKSEERRLFLLVGRIVDIRPL